MTGRAARALAMLVDAALAPSIWMMRVGMDLRERYSAWSDAKEEQ
jgi:hypothetical protein